MCACTGILLKCMLVNQHVSNCECYNLGVLDRYRSAK